MSQRIALLGAGSWGTALALLLARNGHEVLLWEFDAIQVSSIQAERQNLRYLSGFTLPSQINLTGKIAEAAQFSDIILLAVPSHAFKKTLVNLKACDFRKALKIAWATKGFNPDDGLLLHQVVADVFSADTPAAILSGPTFAREVAENLPTAVTIAANQHQFAVQLAELFHGDRFRAYTSTDIVGVEVGGAVKNVLAIAAGIADGLGFGANTRAALITRGLTEMMRLGIKLGGKQETFTGLTGLGDLVLTCTDNQSRNRRFGLALGQGKRPDEIMKEIGQEIEGISTAQVTYKLAREHHLDMPISEQTYKVLYENLPPLSAVQNLFARDQKPELG
jgi:glycerol-3-phosphate dehydrogenase (NAD(P)+)